MKKLNKLKLIEKLNKRLLNEEYNGGEYELPSNHKAALIVPKGGSSCINCKFWNQDTQRCVSEHYIKWNGDGTIPVSPDEYCSDWWEPK
jgi:hypothetical protein